MSRAAASVRRADPGLDLFPSVLLDAASAAVALEPREALHALCSAACEGGRAGGAAVVGWSLGRGRWLASVRLDPTRLPRLARALRRRSRARAQLRAGGMCAVGPQHALPLFVRGRLAGALCLDASALAALGEPAARGLAALAASALAREERERDRKWARKALLTRAAEAEARTAAEVRARLRRLNHDLKTPLVSMKGYVDMLMRGMAGPLTEPMRRYLSAIAQGVERQRNSIDTLCGRG